MFKGFWTRFCYTSCPKTLHNICDGCKLSCSQEIYRNAFLKISQMSQETLRKIPKFHLISWCGNFVETHSFCKILSESPETLGKLKVPTKFPHQKIRWNFGISHSESPHNGDIHCVKSVRTRGFPGPSFSAFGLNMEINGINLRIQSKCGNIRTRKTLNADTFCAVIPHSCKFRDSFPKIDCYRVTYVGFLYFSSTPKLSHTYSNISEEDIKIEFEAM